MKVAVFGAGYVGLVQAAVLADVGNEVLCIEADPRRVEQLARGEVPLDEPGLERLVRAALQEGRLGFAASAGRGLEGLDVIFIAVGTPSLPGGSPDTRQVEAVADEIGACLRSPTVIAIKSTVPVGTAAAVRARISHHLAARGLAALSPEVVSNPEFLREGSAVADCARPDRIVIGAARAEPVEVLRRLYAPFNRNHEKIVVMDEASAELTKYAANGLLATKVSFMNEMAALADAYGADIEKVRHGVGADPRIGYDFLYAGPGFGGSCLPKDVRAALALARDAGVEAGILGAVDRRNTLQKQLVFDRIHAHFGGRLEGRVVAIWGLAYKPGTADMREAPALSLIDALLEAGATIRAHDPRAMAECRRRYPDQPRLILCATKEEAVHGSDALAVVTEWKVYKAPDFAFLARQVSGCVVFDARNLFDAQEAALHGLTIIGIGRNAPRGRK